MFRLHHQLLGNTDRPEVLSGMRRAGTPWGEDVSAVRWEREGPVPQVQWNWKSPRVTPLGY